MAVTTDISIRVASKESRSNDLGESKLTHLLELVKAYGSGTSSNQFDVVYSDTHSAAAAAKTYDVLGSLASVLTGATVSFVDLCGVIVKNNSTTSGDVLSIGAGSNPVTGLWIASGDGVKIGPGGMFIWLDPIDGISPVAGTGDVITVDPGAKTISFSIILLGRSA